MSWNRNIIHVGALNLRKGTVSAQLGSCLVNPTLTITQKNKTIKTIQYDVRKPITIKETICYLREFNDEVQEFQERLLFVQDSYEHYVKKNITLLCNKSPLFDAKHTNLNTYKTHIMHINETITALNKHKTICTHLMEMSDDKQMTNMVKKQFMIEDFKSNTIMITTALLYGIGLISIASLVLD